MIRRYWFWILISPFVLFAVLDVVGYLLLPWGYYPLTDWLVANIPLPWLIGGTMALAAILSWHWWDVWKKHLPSFVQFWRALREELQATFEQSGYGDPNEEEYSREIMKDTITDDFGNYWAKRCAKCGHNTMQVSGIGKAQCSRCG